MQWKQYMAVVVVAGVYLRACATHTVASLSGFDVTAVFVVGCEYD